MKFVSYRNYYGFVYIALQTLALCLGSCDSKSNNSIPWQSLDGGVDAGQIGRITPDPRTLWEIVLTPEDNAVSEEEAGFLTINVGVIPDSRGSDIRSVEVQAIHPTGFKGYESTSTMLPASFLWDRYLYSGSYDIRATVTLKDGQAKSVRHGVTLKRPTVSIGLAGDFSGDPNCSDITRVVVLVKNHRIRPIDFTHEWYLKNTSGVALSGADTVPPYDVEAAKQGTKAITADFASGVREMSVTFMGDLSEIELELIQYNCPGPA